MDANRFDLSNKVAIVTGASRGIGRAAALELARFGADIVIISRKLSDLKVVSEEISKIGRKSLPVEADVGMIQNSDKIVNEVIQEFGKIDILVNNAGVSYRGGIFEIAEEHWDNIMDINLKGPFFLSQSVVKVMKEKKTGSIINIASQAGIRPGIAPLYSISKAGLLMVTLAMARECAAYGIRVNAIAPGITLTSMTEPTLSTPASIEERLKYIPLGRIGKPEDIVGAIVYLASDASCYTTGALILVDGGLNI